MARDSTTGLPEGGTAAMTSASEQHLREIWSWNATVPEGIDRCVHDMIAETTCRQPDAPAICAWDGGLKYGELDELSTRLAHHLVGLGVGPGVIVPLCFEKSMWTPVAMLAVMKAGGASVALDMTLPFLRLQQIVSQSDSLIILCSIECEAVASRFDFTTVLKVDRSLLQADLDLSRLPRVSPSDIIFVTYTSGSSGVPKGACISHGNVCTAVHYQGSRLGFSAISRVLDFAPYSFDVAWSNVLHTLCAGGCLCIASALNMLDDIATCISQLEVNLINVTPTALGTMSLGKSPLRDVLLSGEAPSAYVLSKWIGKVNLKNTYGPAECTFKSAFAEVNSRNMACPEIGRTAGVRSWIVCSEGHDRLAPIGEIGELLLEGPLVGQGYLNDAAKTAAAFIEDPAWLLEGGPGVPGRRGRLYKTGDLVRYNADGTLQFVGRKDAQVKIRGQRVELGEVEHHVRVHLPDHGEEVAVVAEVITPEGSGNATLVAFIGVGAAAEGSAEEVSAELTRVTAGLEDKLAAVLPSYMIPSAYVPVGRIPMTATGKTDRRRLREMGGALTLEQLAALNPGRGERRAPSSEAEKVLQQLWASVLGIDADSVGADDSFLRIGGDSIGAMRLVAAAREQGVSLTVADVFDKPRLCELAEVVETRGEAVAEEEEIAPFSLLRTGVDRHEAQTRAALLCGLEPSRVEDVFPCTPLQEGLLAMTARRAGDYVAREVLKLQGTVDLPRFRAAVEAVWATTPILRTRIVDLPGQGFVQVVANESLRWSTSTDLQAYLHGDAQEAMDAGAPLSRYGLVEDSSQGRRFFVWTLHHSLYDGWSMPLLRAELEKAYAGQGRPAQPPFQAFVKHVVGVDGGGAASFWEAELAGSEAVSFPTLPSAAFRPRADSSVEHRVEDLQWRADDITASTVVRAAWSVLAARYTNSGEVSFGATVTGRQAAVAGIERMTGPTIATVPVRVAVDWEKSVEEVLVQVQQQAVRMIPFEQVGLQRLRRMGAEIERGSQFQTLLVVQPLGQQQEGDGDGDGEGSLPFEAEERDGTTAAGFDAFNTYAMMVVCQLEARGLQLRVSFDSRVIEGEDVRRMAQQFEHVLRQMCAPANGTKKLADMEIASEQDLRDIWSWNATVPERVDRCVHELIAETARRQPEVAAVCAWDGELTYGKLDELSTVLALHLIELGVHPGVIVPLCFEKSMWTPVAMLAVMKAGGVGLLLSSSVPLDRLRAIVRLIRPRVALASEIKIGALCDVPLCRTIQQVLRGKLTRSTPYSIARAAGFHDAVIVFTSGSTGSPKGIIWSHAALAANVTAAGQTFGLGPRSRVFQFASHDFDVSLLDTYSTLAFGGCLCIPSDSERYDGTAAAISRMQANFLCITPSASAAIQCNSVPSLETIVFAGENLQEHIVLKWAGHAVLVNWYGPAECSFAASRPVKLDTWKPGNIGRTSACISWIVDPRNSDILLPLGALGELVLEGQGIASGYIQENTAVSPFIEDPMWLLKGGPGVVGRRGRLYKTGDLVRYNADGTLQFVGRKDAQVKIRGQRVELGEVEHHVQRCLAARGEAESGGGAGAVVAEVITPRGSETPTLVVFVAVGEATADQEAAVKRATLGVDEQMARAVPAYMIPSAYIPVGRIPATATGKTDRRRLREMGEAMTREQLAALHPSRGERRAPSSEAEKVLQQLWASVLGIDADSVGADDSFLRIGGDSIGAMRLVAAAREQGVSLTVADVFDKPRLCELAEVVETRGEAVAEEEEIAPFSLLRTGVDRHEAQTRAALLCGLEPSRVEDVFPCTPLQEGLLAMTARRAGDYVAREVLKLQGTVDLPRFRAAVEAVWATTPILRTRIVDLPGQGFVQVVANESLRWSTSTDLQAYLHGDAQEAMDAGAPLSRYGLVEDSSQGRRFFVWTLHHSLYDGWSMPLLRAELEKAYAGQGRPAQPPFQAFVKHVVGVDGGGAASFWEAELAGSEAVSFPTLPSAAFRPRADSSVEHRVEDLQWRADDITASTVVRAAWSVLAARYTNSGEVSFGATVTGRQAAVAGIERMTGPTIATVPVRVAVDWEKSVEEVLVQVQQQAVRMIPFEQVGLQRLRRMGAEIERGSQFQTLLVVQPLGQQQEGDGDGDGEGSLPFEAEERDGTTAAGFDAFNTYAMKVVCQLEARGLQLRVSFDSRVIEGEDVRRMAQQFEHVLRQMCAPANGTRKLATIATAGNRDLRDIWSWNATVPERVDRCVHELIAETARRQPEVAAVCAWDGELTYGKLDELSTVLALHLIELGVHPGVIVPLCFEKSMWTPVAMLAVMKAGGASVAMDTKQPEERLRSIVQQVSPLLIVSSALNESLASRLGGENVVAVVVSASNVARLQAPVHMDLPMVHPVDMLYLAFTSGSTGTPKGAMINHANFASALQHQFGALGIHSTSRVFDFASYAFDVAWSNVLHTFFSGGCLCISSEGDRLSHLALSIRQSKATVINITPSISRLLDPKEIPSVHTLILSGEPVTASDLQQWQASNALINTYGPAECSVKSTIMTVGGEGTGEPSIGSGLGINTWVADADDHEQLVPVGCTGELLLEGPLVGQGYLNDAAKTAAAFIEDPAWLLEGGPGVPGRRGRLYKTGDLVRYNADGTLQFVGRKDAQVKIRGQRVELGEVEHHVRVHLPDHGEEVAVVAEVITPEGSGNATLVAFIGVGAAAEGSAEEVSAELTRVTAGLEDKLAAVLPSYMIPSAYVPVGRIPMTATGKTDRRRLREMGGALTLEQLAALNPGRGERRAPSSEAEKVLQQLWASVLGIDADSVGADDSFLRIGGDSIGAMRLVAAAREQGVSLTVADVFDKPRLCELAEVVETRGEAVAEEEEIAPFSLLRTGVDRHEAQTRAALLCGLEPSRVEDVFPCTPLQEGLLAMTARRAGDYVAREVLKLQGTVDLPRFRAAVEAVWATTPILRTRIVDLPGQGFVQVVANESLRWSTSTDLQAYLHGDAQEAMDAGAPLSRYGLVEDSSQGRRFFVWTLHHSLYDGWSMPLLRAELEKAYAGQGRPAQPPFQAFVKHVVGVDGGGAASFWEAELAGSEAVSFPTLPSAAFRPRADSSVEHRVEDLQWRADDITASTVVRAAWSVLAARYTNSGEVSFGATVTGRQAAVAGIERMTGPTIATVPVRVAVDWEKSVEEVLVQVQQQAVRMIPFEQVGLQRLRRMGAEIERGSQFQTLLVVQPLGQQQEGDGDGDGEGSLPFEAEERDGTTAAGFDAFNTYAMMVVCQLEARGLQLRVSFDSRVIEGEDVRRMAQQFEHVLRQMCAPANGTKKLADMEIASEQDLRDIWSWNATVPERVDRCVHELIAETARRQPEVAAVCAWDGELTYGKLDELSTVLALHLIELGVHPGVIVPLCFEKSMWTPVAMLAVMKAGGASVAMDTTQPVERLRSIVQQVSPRLILSSVDNSGVAGQLGRAGVLTVLVDAVHLAQLQSDVETELPTVQPSDQLYVVFTSGSTGTPKGAIISHANFASALEHQSDAPGINSTSRVYDFASYAFDAAWSNVLFALFAGGCLCIPSESDRRTRLAQSIQQLEANFLDITPSVVRLLRPSEVPSLCKLVLGGEPIVATDVDQWLSSVVLINTYGPAECTVTSTLANLGGNETRDPSIGRGLGVNTWVVDPSDHERLVPAGCTGELLLEGPLVGQGYLNDAAKTAAAFIEDPAWLLEGGPGVPGRRGRLYKTGDLVRYNADGTLQFVGRKDAQVKIRGQRVELGEVEHHVRVHLPDHGEEVAVVAEVITPEGSGNATLVAFIGVGAAAEGSAEEVSAELTRVTAGLEDKLAAVLPSYMIPSAYVPVGRIPMTATGKTDRRRLREMGGALTLEQLAALNPGRGERRAPSSEAEKVLQQLWASVLGIDADSVGADDSFLRIGGDSIGAMRLVAAAREQGVSLTVADVFDKPRLCELAEVVETRGEAVAEEEEIAPFSLLRTGVDRHEAQTRAALLCGLEPSRVEDVFPCTPLQEGLLAMTARRAGDYVAREVLKLQGTVDLPRFRAAVEAVWATTPILRTRIVDLPGQGFVQVVANESLRWSTSTDLQAYLHGDAQEAMDAGAPLSRYGLVEDSSQGRRFFVWTLHHSLYDGWSMPLLRAELEKAYAGQGRPAQPPFQAFVKHVVGVDGGGAASFWEAELAGSEAVSFPTLPSAAFRPRADSSVEHRVEDLQWRADDITASTVVRAAWSVLAARYTNSGEVSFGATVTGRQAAVAGIERMTGPTIATVPVRVAVDWEKSVEEVLVQVQQQAVRMIPFEQVGLQRLRRMGAEIERGSQFQTLLVVQPLGQQQEGDGDGDGEGSLPFEAEERDGTTAAGFDAFNTYAMMVVCQLEARGLQLRVSFDSRVIEGEDVRRMAQQFEHVLRQMCAPANGTKKLADMEIASEQDLRDIWSWNATVPERVDRCVHELIAETARRQPEVAAVCAWDGELTYGKLDELSTVLALHLIELGVHPGVIVPLCFEKSMWTPVAMLAVMKAGGVGLLLSSSVPLDRLRAIVRLIRPRVALASEIKIGALCDVPLCRTIQQVLRGKLTRSTPYSIARAAGFHDAVIVFTSGSTGSPKGIIWSHAALAANVTAAGQTFGLGPRSRVFQFASHDFDVSLLDTYSTLAFGGCLCIPSDSERYDGTAAAISRMQANFLCITPSASAAIQCNSVPSLETIVFAGENLQEHIVLKWAGHAVLVNWYGPAECSFAASRPVKLDTWKPGNIGRTSACISWIVDPRNSDILLPLGALGELVLEGQGIASGYIQENTAVSPFIEDPMWLLKGGPGVVGRRGRLYKTGDLVRYNADGTLQFVGRKDAQVKIRGQRVELGEVEHHVQRCLAARGEAESGGGAGAVVAEVITPRGSETPTLVVFVAVGEATADQEAAVKRATLGVDEQMARAVPAYMIPSAYIPVGRIPATATGKTDRRRLREMGEAMTREQLAALHPSRGERRAPSSEAEKVLQQLWASVLGIDADSVGADDSFLRIGGDSIGAMRLVAAAREQGVSLTVADVFDKPRLCELAEVVETRGEAVAEEEEIAPFSLLRTGVDRHEAQTRAALLCGLEPSRVEDVFPCTPLQEGLLAMTARRAGDYVAREVLKLQGTVDLPRFRAAVEAVWATTPILRTRIVDLPGQGFVQVVANESLRWSTSTDLQAYLHGDAQEAMDAGAPLSRYGLVEDSSQGRRFFVWTLHHSLYDGWSMPLLRAELEKAYAGQGRPAQPPFQAFVKHVVGVDGGGAASFWEAELAGSEAVSFPTLPSAAFRPRADSSVEHRVEDLQWRADDITASTVVRAAWSVLAARYTNSGEVSFGATVTGRQAAVAGIERMTGPTIATVPVRVAVDWEKSVEEVLVQVQQQAVRMIPFEQVGLQRLRRMGAEIERGSQFQTLLVVQPLGQQQEGDGDGDGEGSLPFEAEERDGTTAAGFDAFNTYAMMVVCQLEARGLQLRVSFDSRVIEGEDVRRMAQQFEHVLWQMCAPANGTRKLATIATAGNRDLRDIWSWNATVPERVDRCVHELIAETTLRQPAAAAVCAWDGELTYGELDALSTRLAHHLVGLGVGPGVIVPLCFEKSMWTPVAMLAVLKAGGASVPLDPSQRTTRQRDILEQVGAKVIVASGPLSDPLSRHLIGSTCMVVVTASDESLRNLPADDGRPKRHVARSSPSDLAYVMFTSGSTGRPKGVALEHRAVSTSCKAHGRIMRFGVGSRVLQFASHVFDASIAEILTTLIFGGCICIPCDRDRLENISAVMNDLRVNWAFLTPSMARSLQQTRFPELQTLVLGGEKPNKNDYQQWKPVQYLINGYGPTECCVFCTAYEVPVAGAQTNNIGKAVGSVAWVTDSRDDKILVPLGTVGELLVEGPILARGYFNEVEKTAAAFIEDPPWLLGGGPGVAGRRGRLYKTGDLVRYNADGTLQFVGRKDAQVKIRGQRVELGEVEHHVQRCLAARGEAESGGGAGAVVAEVITPRGSETPTLVVFVAVGEATADQEAAVKRATLGVDEQMARAVPAYMIPSAYIPVGRIPATATGKTDRRRLREMGEAMTREQLAALHPSRGERRAPSSEAEKVLQQLWASVLGIDADSVGADDSFLRIGGDSIGAMRLVAAAREQGLFFAVADVFQHPRLCDLAVNVEVVDSANVDVANEPAPFSLIATDDAHSFVESLIVPQMAVGYERILDVLPTTAFQKLCVREALLDPPSRWVHFIFDLPANVDFDRLKLACSLAVEQLDILRMVFIALHGVILQVLKENVNTSFDLYENHGNCLEFVAAKCEDDLRRKRKLGQSFVRFFAVKDPVEGNKLVFRCSHAHYDGFCLESIFDTVFSLYDGSYVVSRNPGFAGYLAYTCRKKRDSIAHWQSRLRGLYMFGWKQGRFSNPVDDSRQLLELRFKVKTPTAGEVVSIASLFHAAFALALSRIYKTPDVLFGRLVTGRVALPPSLQRTIGPCIVELPVPVRIYPRDALQDVAARLQQQFIQDSQFESVGMADIIENCTDWPSEVDDFGWRTAFQPDFKSMAASSRVGSSYTIYERASLPRRRPEIYAEVTGEELEVTFSSDRTTLSHEIVGSLLDTMQSILGDQ